MARYNIRDLLGHWVKPRQRQGKMCPHACCRNRRVHPANFPVILPRELLRKAPERDLIRHWQDQSHNERAVAQVMREIDRREEAGNLKLVRKKAAERRRFTRGLERRELVEAEINRAERETRGELVNKAGKRAGVTVDELFTGRESRALRYAAPELLDYWSRHPRPTAANLSANPRVVRNARARSDLGRTPYRSLY
jgi:hypothetical protein